MGSGRSAELADTCITMFTPNDRRLAQKLIRYKAVSVDELYACRQALCARGAADGQEQIGLAELLVERGALDRHRIDRLRNQAKQAPRRSASSAPRLLGPAVTASLPARSGQRGCRLAGDDRRHGSVLGGMQLIKPIARGSSGSVYKGADPAYGHSVAVKILSAEAALDGGAERFVRESNTVCNLRHHNLVRGIRAGCEGGVYYFVMEYVDGQSLGERVRYHGPLPEAEVVAAGKAMCSVLEFIRQHGLVHRDVKPDNILREDSGRLKLCDFGLVRSMSCPSSLTSHGVAVGTPKYISPEQARGLASVDHRSDLYSLGVTLFHLAAGRAPFDGSSGIELLTKHITLQVPDVRSLRPDLSSGVAAVIRRATRKDPNARFETAGSMARALAAC